MTLLRTTSQCSKLHKYRIGRLLLCKRFVIKAMLSWLAALAPLQKAKNGPRALGTVQTNMIHARQKLEFGDVMFCHCSEHATTRLARFLLRCLVENVKREPLNKKDRLKESFSMARIEAEKNIYFLDHFVGTQPTSDKTRRLTPKPDVAAESTSDLMLAFSNLTL